MKNPTELSDSSAHVIENPDKCARCDATTRLVDGLCIHCFLHEGLEAEGEASREAFESVLAEADVPDKEWRLGHYEILEEIGRGGMGVIYRARQQHSRRIVAVKRILAYQVESRETLVRFRREAEAAASLDHPNVLPIYEVSESEDGLPFFSMKYATGGSLRAAAPALRARPNDCVRLIAKVARAIAYAHDHGILHRDLQPGNILLDKNGEPLVSDFGLAKWLDENSDLTRTLTTFGTPGYIAPEQAECAATDLGPAADIYSLGAILFHLLTGRPPFVGANALSVIHQASVAPAPRLRSLAPSLDRNLETIVARSLEREPQARYQSAGALAEDLERWLDGRPIRARRVVPPARIWRWSRRNPILAAAATTCLVLVAAVVWLLRDHSSAPPRVPPAEKSIVVLPLQNLSGDPAQEYFVDGMTDALIGDLAQLTRLRVISRTSAMHYKGTKKSLPQIAQELQVDAVIEGTVQHADGRVRIRAQLIEARSDRHLWAQTYERDLQDILKLQSDIAQAIAREVRAKTTPAEVARLTSRPHVRPKAFDDYLKGRYLYWNKRTVENLGKAIQYFESAIREDPTYALPYVGVADCYNAMGSVQFSALPPPQARRRAEEAALKALELDPTLAEAHSALGYVRHYSWDWAAAEEEFKRATELNPNCANAYNFYASYLMSRGRTDEVFVASNRARELDPLSLSISAQRGFLLFLARRYEESIEELRGIIATDPNHYQAHWFLAHTYAANGKLDDAIATAEKAAALGARRPGALGILGMAYGFAGKKDEATKVLRELLELNKRGYVTPAAFVFAYTGVGDKDQAFLWMEKSYQERSNFMAFLRFIPLLDSLRSDPRFEEMLQRINLPNYSTAAAPLPNGKSIAVLPFDDLSGETENAFFANGGLDEF